MRSASVQDSILKESAVDTCKNCQATIALFAPSVASLAGPTAPAGRAAITVDSQPWCIAGLPLGMAGLGREALAALISCNA